MERESLDALDPLIPAPFVAGSIGAGYEQAMKDREKDGPFHVELELALFQEIANDFSDPQFLPEPLENDGGADLLCRGLDIGIIPGGENQHDLFGKAREGTNKIVNFSFGLHLIDAAQGCDNSLDGFLSFTAIFDELQILILT
jgi:hypothetical protein